MNTPERLDTPEFVIRCYQPGDGPALFAAVASSRAHLAPYMPWHRAHTDAAFSEAYARASRGKWLLGQDFALGVWDVRETRLLGGTGFHVRKPAWAEVPRAEIGMWITAGQAGQGLGTRVLESMLTWGFSAWDWQRLGWRCDTENLASARVAEKCGMTREGVLRREARSHTGALRDTVIYAALR